MFKQAILAGIAFVIALSLAQSPLLAQRRYMSPFGPTLTPYLNYFRRDTGAIGDPYNAFVVPRRELRQTLGVQQQNIYGLQQQVRQANQEIENIRQPLAAPTGTGATFMNYSHYYQMPPARRR